MIRRVRHPCDSAGESDPSAVDTLAAASSTATPPPPRILPAHAALRSPQGAVVRLRRRHRRRCQAEQRDEPSNDSFGPLPGPHGRKVRRLPPRWRLSVALPGATDGGRMPPPPTR